MSDLQKKLNPMIEKLKKFFYEDFSEILGVYYDGEKIFFAHIADTTEFFETTFELKFDKDFSEFEQLAEKISVVCSQRGWKNFRLGICLRESEILTTYQEFKNIPAEEILNATQSWATSHSESVALSACLKVGENFWLEAISKDVADKYIYACEKISLKLCALTATPESLNLSELERAEFVAEVIKNNKSPNFLKISENSIDRQKIIFVVAAIFILILGVLTAKTFYDLNQSEENLAAAQKNLSEYGEILELKNVLNEDIEATKKINLLAAEQKNSVEKLNALIKIGKIADGKIWLTKISASENIIELEGVADSSTEIKNYLNRLKSTVSKKSSLESSEENQNEQINFIIQIEF